MYLDCIVDISHWNGSPDEIDFNAMREDGILAVIIKATEGKSYSWVRWFDRCARKAQSADLLVGAYHFCTSAGAADQARYFMDCAGPCLKLFLDVESYGEDTCSVPRAADIASRIRADLGAWPGVYIPIDGPYGDGSGLPNAMLGQCALWLPHYTGMPQPRLPDGWDILAIWQYTDKGIVLGIDGVVDRNRWNGTEDELRAWWRA